MLHISRWLVLFSATAALTAASGASTRRSHPILLAAGAAPPSFAQTAFLAGGGSGREGSGRRWSSSSSTTARSGRRGRVVSRSAADASGSVGGDDRRASSSSPASPSPRGCSRRDVLSAAGRVSRIAAGTFAAATTAAAAPAYASTRDPKTGILLPSEGEIKSSIPSVWDDGDDPLSSMSKDSFSRLDSSNDGIFYSEPRFVEHVDEQAVRTMTSYISDRLIRPGDAVLDLCSSWTSHVRPDTLDTLRLSRFAGLGMNVKELEANKSLTEWTVRDLNAGKGGDVALPYADGSFDVVLCQLSVDYLVHPLEVMREASRVMKPGGTVAVLFSNRIFLTKAVGMWTGSDDIDHAYTVGSFLHYCNGGFENVRAEDLSTRKVQGREKVIVGDPMYVVTATKRRG